MRKLLIILLVIFLGSSIAINVEGQAEAPNNVKIVIRYVDLDSFDWRFDELNGYAYYPDNGQSIVKTLEYTFESKNNLQNRKTCILTVLSSYLPESILNNTDVLTPEDNSSLLKSIIISSTKYKEYFTNSQLLSELAICGDIEISLRIGGREASQWIEEELDSKSGALVINHLIDLAKNIFKIDNTWIYVIDGRDIVIPILTTDVNTSQIIEYLTQARDVIPIYTPIILEIGGKVDFTPQDEYVQIPDDSIQTPIENIDEDNQQETGEREATKETVEVKLRPYIYYTLLIIASTIPILYILATKHKKP